MLDDCHFKFGKFSKFVKIGYFTKMLKFFALKYFNKLLKVFAKFQINLRCFSNVC